MTQKKYAPPAQVSSREGPIYLHDAPAFDSMRAAGKLASQVLDFITPYVQPGITTEELNRLCHDFIIKAGAIPAPLGYRGFPKSICTSVNHVVCHGIPGPYVLVTGDILNIDVTVILDGWHGDTSRTFKVGHVSALAERLIAVTYEAMMLGIQVVRPGATLGDVGHAIQRHVEKNGFSVVRDFCGHGIGQTFHAAPCVLHFGKPKRGLVLMEGMFLTIEPMVNVGRADSYILDDGWTALTEDHSLSAQFEHTLGVTDTGYEIFT